MSSAGLWLVILLTVAAGSGVAAAVITWLRDGLAGGDA